MAPEPRPERAAAWRRHGLAAVLLAGFVALLFGRLLFTNRVLASGDILHYFYPYRDFAAAALREGRIPLWNPYIFLGVPFLANPQAAVLYPLHWPLSWLPVTKQIYWSGALHCWILGLGAYSLLRHWRVETVAALAGGILLAGSGFVGGLLGHINQLNGVTWLPWMLLAVEGVRRSRRIAPWIGFFGALVALSLLAGHTQSAYINLFATGLWVVLRSGPGTRRSAGAAGLISRLWRPGLVLTAGTPLGILVSAAQLLPTLELSRLGLRSGGLSYGEASSFSLKPLSLAWTLLPTYGLQDLSVTFGTLGYTEYVAYLGGAGLLLATWAAWHRRRSHSRALIFLAAAGLFLALGRWNPVYYLLFQVVPGFDLFRAPARWMMLYTLGMALLAGVGFARLPWRRLDRGWRTAARILLLLLMGLELLVAGLALPHTHPTAPEAVYGPRTAPAHLLTDPEREELGGAVGRFLSMSSLTFDPGDMEDYRRIYREGADAPLDPQAFDQLVIAQKSQELLAPNLSLLWRIPAVDGFDGGVLPLQRFIQALDLFIPQTEIVPDGRLREQLDQIPAAFRLNLLNVRYVITDKLRDHWHEDVYYDRQIGARLGAGGYPEIRMTAPLPFQATHLAVLGALMDEADAPPWQNGVLPGLRFHVTATDGPDQALTLTLGGGPGAHFADGRLNSPWAVQSGAQVAYRDVEGGRQEYVALLPLSNAVTPVQIRVRHVANAPDVQVQAVTLVDRRTGTFAPLLPSDRGRFSLVHSGDVKVYENLDRLQRAFLVHNTVSVSTLPEALEWLQGTQVGPQEISVVEGGPSLQGRPLSTDDVQILSYTPESITLRTRSAQPALLVLADGYFPGWSATVNGQPASIYPTNALMRGVSVPAGDHEVRFHYRPEAWRQGLWLSGLGLALCLALLGVPPLLPHRRGGAPSRR